MQGERLLPCQETDEMRDHSSNLLLFGATGDLSRRMLLPSLYALHADGLITRTCVFLEPLAAR